MRVVQLSDLHYAPGQAADDELIQVERLVDQLRPALIVVSGDLTREGLVEQFDPVVRFLERLGMERVRAIPGNRDYPATRRTMRRPTDSDLHYFLTAPDTPEVENEAPGVTESWTLFTDFFQAVDVFERFAELTLVALDSEPRISEESFSRALDYFAGSSPSVPRMFCTHRALLPAPGKKLKEGDLLPDAGDLLEGLLTAKVDVALCAHLHRPHAWTIGSACRSILVVAAPPLLGGAGGKTTGLITIDLGEGLTIGLHEIDGGSRVLARTTIARSRPA